MRRTLFEYFLVIWVLLHLCVFMDALEGVLRQVVLWPSVRYWVRGVQSLMWNGYLQKILISGQALAAGLMLYFSTARRADSNLFDKRPASRPVRIALLLFLIPLGLMFADVSWRFLRRSFFAANVFSGPSFSWGSYIKFMSIYLSNRYMHLFYVFAVLAYVSLNSSISLARKRRH